MGGAVSAGEDNDELIDKLVNANYIKTPDVESIFRAVDRGFYYLPSHRSNAYRDQAWRCNNLHLSAPCIYSEVMEALQIKPGLSFLNIGSGTGYLSTLVGLLLGSRGVNHGIELHSEVVKYAQNKLNEFLSHSPALYRYDFAEPCFVVGNAITVLLDDPIKHQYDRVYCGAAVPPELECFMRNLLKINGILVMPFGENLVQVTRKSESEYEPKSVLSVNFASLVTPSSHSSSSNNNSRHEHKRMDACSDDDPTSAGKGYCSKLPDLQPFSLKVLCRLRILQLLRSTAETEITNERGTANHLRTQATKRRVIAKTAKIARKVSQRLTAPIFEETDSSSSTNSSIGISVSSVISSDDGISDSDKSYAGDSSSNENNGQRGNSVILQASSRPIDIDVSTNGASEESYKSATGEGQSVASSSSSLHGQSGPNGSGGGETGQRDTRASALASEDGHLSDMLYIDRLRNIIDSATSISHALSRFINSGLEEEPTSSSSTSSSSSPVTSGPEHLTQCPASEKSVIHATQSADSNGDSGKVSGGSQCSFADSGIASASSGSAMESSSKRSISVTEEEEETDGAKVANSSSNGSELGNNSDEMTSVITLRARTRARTAEILRNRRRTKLRRVVLVNTDSDDSESPELSDNGSSSNTRTKGRANERKAQKTGSDDDEDDSVDSSEEERKRDEGTDLLVKPWHDDHVIRRIKQKIQLLPLPPTLQVYVNLCRPLKPSN